MKKMSLILVLMLLLTLPVFGLAESEPQETPEVTPAEQTTPYAWQRGRGRMGNNGTTGQNYSDINEDGVCDNCEANYVDANEDGVCDNCERAQGEWTRGRMRGGRMAQGRGRGAQGAGRGTQGQAFGHGWMNRNQPGNPNYVDENKDGVCDHFAEGIPGGMNRNQPGNPNYVDENKDGVCDYYEDTTGRPGRGGMPGRRPR